MDKHEGTLRRVISASQMKLLISCVTNAVPADLSDDESVALLDPGTRLAKKVRKLIWDEAKVSEVRAQVIGEWENFYRDELQIQVDLSKVRLPRPRKGWIYRVIAGRQQQAWEVTKQKFGAEACWEEERDLDDVFTLQDRDARLGAYAILVRDSAEPDEYLANLSAFELWTRKIRGITFHERLIHGLKYWRETGTVLDREYGTVCCGSLDNEMLRMTLVTRWQEGKVHVRLQRYKAEYPSARARQVVAAP